MVTTGCGIALGAKAFGTVVRILVAAVSALGWNPGRIIANVFKQYHNS